MFLFAGNSLSISCNSGHSISLFYWAPFKTLLFKNSKTKMDTLHTECDNSVASCSAHDKCCFQSNLCQFWHIHEIWWLGQTCGARNSSKFREITIFLIVLITCTLIIKKTFPDNLFTGIFMADAFHLYNCSPWENLTIDKRKTKCAFYICDGCHYRLFAMSYSHHKETSLSKVTSCNGSHSHSWTYFNCYLYFDIDSCWRRFRISLWRIVN